MNGARNLLETAVALGVEVVFANPGTTEFSLIAALDEVPGMRAVLGLQENMLSGASDGYSRMALKPALTTMHLGPSFANSVSNLHNARRARSSIVNVVGDHPTWHRASDPPMASDIAGLAAATSDWVRTCKRGVEVAADIADAIDVASAGNIATLIVPADCQWDDAGPTISPVGRARNHPSVDKEQIPAIAKILRRGRANATLLLGGKGLSRTGLLAAGRIAGSSGCNLLCESFPARLEIASDLPLPRRVPYMPLVAQDVLSSARDVVLVGAADPVAFFVERGGASRLVPAAVTVHVACSTTGDAVGTLEALADELGGNAAQPAPPFSAPPAPVLGRSRLSPQAIVSAIVRWQTDGAVIIDEGISAHGAYLATGDVRRKPATYLSLTGGACGFAMPCAVGAAIACPDRKVVVISGDGSAMYTPQALWTQAHELLDVVNVIISNNAYRILEMELVMRGDAEPGQKSLALTRLASPRIDWVALSSGLGVTATRVDTLDALDASLRRAFSTPGPKLIEVICQ